MLLSANSSIRRLERCFQTWIVLMKGSGELPYHWKLCKLLMHIERVTIKIDRRKQQLDNRRMENWVLSVEWCIIDFPSHPPHAKLLLIQSFLPLNRHGTWNVEEHYSSGRKKLLAAKYFCSNEFWSQNFLSVRQSYTLLFQCAQLYDSHNNWDTEDVAFSSNVNFNEIWESPAKNNFLPKPAFGRIENQQ